jgi:hypothetical protein
MPAGSLPASWANLSSAVPTALVLANNQLTGGIPDAYGGRISLVSNMTSWAELDLSNNMHMCGPVQSWFYSNVTKGMPSAAVVSLQGNSIGKISKLHIFRCYSKCALNVNVLLWALWRAFATAEVLLLLLPNCTVMLQEHVWPAHAGQMTLVSGLKSSTTAARW